MKVDALTPAEITEEALRIGVYKANKPLLPQCLLGILAGIYIGFGAVLYTMVKSDHSLGFFSAHILAGLVFSTGLILVAIAGADLFTGNNLMTIAWAEKQISTQALLKNWTLVIATNGVGAVLLALLIYGTGHADMNHGEIANAYVKAANAKCALPFWTAFLRGIGCNMLVCLAMWLAYAGRTVTDKILGIVFPVTAFVAVGFEHSVANMYILAMGLLTKGDVSVASDALTLGGCLHNLIPVLFGNIIGGGVFVGLIYWAIFLRKAK